MDPHHDEKYSAWWTTCEKDATKAADVFGWSVGSRQWEKVVNNCLKIKAGEKP